jgi:DNA-binding MarR family transcriptional regulator
MTTETQQTRWLDDEQQHAWRGLLLGMTLLTDRLDADLRREFGLSNGEYEILVRLSESPDHSMRMSRLADGMAHSRSRVTHTVARMQSAGLVSRCEASDDGRGIFASLTEKGWTVLQAAAHVHVRGVREYLVDRGSPEDFLAMGRLMNAVTDHLIGGHPEMEIR